MDPALERRQRIIADIEISERVVPLLKLLHPLNEEEQREKFLAGDIEEPTFTYGTTSFFDLPTLQPESPIDQLLLERRTQAQLQLDLVRARGDDERFCQVSEELFPIDTLLDEQVALERAHIPAEEGEFYDVRQAMALFEEALHACGIHTWTVRTDLHLTSRIRAAPYEKTLLFHPFARIPRSELPGLIRHEIGVHVLRFEHGLAQSEPLLHVGTAKGNLLEEGIACALENPDGPGRIFLRYHAVLFARAHTFRETWKHVHGHGHSPEEAWRITLRVKRGLQSGASHGAFTRDATYLDGYFTMMEAMKGDLNLPALLSARVHPSEIDLLRRCTDFTVFPLPSLFAGSS